MKINLCLLACLLLCSIASPAQKYITKNGHIRFYSDSPLEKIEAHNRQVNSAFDASNGNFVCKVLMKSFEFEKALMQEHFNENYVESDKYPDATFIGKVLNFKDINFGKDGLYHANIQGKLTMHGISKEISEKGTFEVKQGKLTGKSKFNIVLADFKISIPGTVVNNISKSIEITVDVTLEKANL
jgi:polyisoprenoid-binding protein YceI